jgi:hypothetical protein
LNPSNWSDLCGARVVRICGAYEVWCGVVCVVWEGVELPRGIDHIRPADAYTEDHRHIQSLLACSRILLSSPHPTATIIATSKGCTRDLPAERHASTLESRGQWNPNRIPMSHGTRAAHRTLYRLAVALQDIKLVATVLVILDVTIARASGTGHGWHRHKVHGGILPHKALQTGQQELSRSSGANEGHLWVQAQ